MSVVFSFLWRRKGRKGNEKSTHQASRIQTDPLQEASSSTQGLPGTQRLLFWNEQREARRAILTGCGSVAGGRMLGACICQAKTDGELTLCIALGAEM